MDGRVCACSLLCCAANFIPQRKGRREQCALLPLGASNLAPTHHRRHVHPKFFARLARQRCAATSINKLSRQFAQRRNLQRPRAAISFLS